MHKNYRLRLSHRSVTRVTGVRALKHGTRFAATGLANGHGLSGGLASVALQHLPRIRVRFGFLRDLRGRSLGLRRA